MNTKKIILVFLGFFNCLFLQAQDTLSLFQTLEQQLPPETTFKQDFYYNPANMSDYSILSRSYFETLYQDEKRQKHLLQEGSNWNGIEIKANSFQKLQNNNTIWGSISYKNQTQREVQWNNNIDYERVAPYVFADSTKGTNKFEGYAFEGGLSKKYNKLQIGAQLGYKAHMNYRDRDPRPKSVSSDMSLKLGANYPLYNELRIGISGDITKYIQNIDVKFANETEQARLYQMTGLGTWNYYFSTRSTRAVYESFGYRTGIYLSNKNARDFAFTATYGKYQLNKNVMYSGSSNSDGYEINKLDHQVLSLTGLKFYYLDQHQLGLKVKYEVNKKTGADILYTNNEEYLQKLTEKKRYLWENFETSFEVLYNYKATKYSINVIPSFIIQKTEETLKEVNNSQQFIYHHFGLQVQYSQELKKNSSLSFSPFINYRNVVKADKEFNTKQTSQAIHDWIENDFNFLSSNIMNLGTSLRYDIQLPKLPALYTRIEATYTLFEENKHNQYYGIALGATF